MGTDAKTEEIGEDELLDILATLESHGIKQRYTFTKVVSAKKLYHFDSLERLEKTVICPQVRNLTAEYANALKNTT